jgi:hypothetical protein
LFAAEFGAHRIMRYAMTWDSASAPLEPPALVERLAMSAGVVRVDWQPVEAGHLAD